MRRMMLMAAVVCSALWWAATPAHAGGWAMSTLDEPPVPVAGQPLDVGFTILQHGVTPVHLDGDVGIGVTTANGTSQYFPARAVGAVGHYVATVTLDAAGPTTWVIHQDWFPRQELGEIVVAPASALTSASAATSPTTASTGSPQPLTDAAGGSPYRWPGPVRYALVACAALLVALAVADARRSRRRLAVARP